MRLTEKGMAMTNSLDEKENQVALIYNKLGQLEDIEEEFGIDLITLFKALKNGIWHIRFGKPVFVYPENLYVDNEMTLYEMYFNENTGNTLNAIAKYNDPIFKWALTKEELK